ncbi:MAG: hypothetical protein WC319_05845 [Candidatus Paceibacterota bacterium]|jgi:hypothetical protein
MSENIEKRKEEENINLEQISEKKDVINESKTIRKGNNLNKEKLLDNIYSKENKISEIVESVEKSNNSEERLIDNAIRRLKIVGVKAIGEARKVLSGKGLDDLHDRITNENKKSDK